jgi:hypothetical protein
MSKRREDVNDENNRGVERRKEMKDIVVALNANTTAIKDLEGRFGIFCVVSEEQAKTVSVLKDSVLGNGKLGLDKRVMKLEIYAAIIVGLCSTGVIGTIGYIIVKGVELVYTHGSVTAVP